MKKKVIAAMCCAFGCISCLSSLALDIGRANASGESNDETIDTINTDAAFQYPNEVIDCIDHSKLENKEEAEADFYSWVSLHPTRTVNGKTYTAIFDDTIEKFLTCPSETYAYTYHYGFGNWWSTNVYSFATIMLCSEVTYIDTTFSGTTIFPEDDRCVSFGLSEGSGFAAGYDFETKVGGGFGGFVEAGITLGFSKEWETTSELDVSFNYEFTDKTIEDKRVVNYGIKICRLSFLVFRLIPNFSCDWTQYHLWGGYMPNFQFITVDLYTSVSYKYGGTY